MTATQSPDVLALADDLEVLFHKAISQDKSRPELTEHELGVLHNAAKALRAIPQVRAEAWDAGEHEGCGIDSERAFHSISARKIIRPFAEAADDLDDHHPDSSPIWESSAAMSINARDLRAARDFLALAHPPAAGDVSREAAPDALREAMDPFVTWLKWYDELPIAQRRKDSDWAFCTMTPTGPEITYGQLRAALAILSLSVQSGAVEPPHSGDGEGW